MAKITPALISQVRSTVLSTYEENKSLYEESDIQRLKNEDLLVERYLTREKLDPLAAIETMNGAFKFGKRQGIGSINESEFSPELLSLVQYQGKDKNGQRTVYFRYKTGKKILKRNSKEGEKLKRLSLYYFKKIDDETKGKNTIIIDFRSLAIRDLVKYANKDLAELLAWLVTNIIRYSPDHVGTVLLYEIPRFFNAIAERVVKLIPDEHSGKIKLVRKKDIEKFVSKDELPEYMGGKLKIGDSGAVEEDDSGDEGDGVNNLEDIERVLDAEENTRV